MSIKFDNDIKSLCRKGAGQEVSFCRGGLCLGPKISTVKLFLLK